MMWYVLLVLWIPVVWNLLMCVSLLPAVVTAMSDAIWVLVYVTNTNQTLFLPFNFPSSIFWFVHFLYIYIYIYIYTKKIYKRKHMHTHTHIYWHTHTFICFYEFFVLLFKVPPTDIKKNIWRSKAAWYRYSLGIHKYMLIYRVMYLLSTWATDTEKHHH